MRYVHIILIVVIVALGTFFLFEKSVKSPVVNSVEQMSVVDSVQVPTFASSTAIVSGTTFTKDTYKLFLTQEGEDNTYAEFTYTKQGVVETGPFAGYTQLLVTRTYDGPSLEGAGVFAFITKDFKTFLVTKQYSFLSDEYQKFNKDVVLGVADFKVSHLEKIEYKGLTFVRNEIYQEKEYLRTSKGQKLFDINGLTAYAEHVDYADENISSYVEGTSRLWLEDMYGVIFAYSPYTEGAEGVVFATDDFVDFKKGYSVYGDAIPEMCGVYYSNKILKNIKTEDLVKVTSTKSNTEVYVLKNKNHPLLKAQYQRKIDDQKEYFTQVNPEYKKVPTYDEYVSRYPILVYKDIWDRWNTVGEFQYKVDGGCGKPVIYLYPTKPTDVSISFAKPVRLTVDIPSYDSGWNVRADSFGNLTDLQPDKTDCDKINPKKLGLEYAKDACISGVYPYIYWAGDVKAKYPKVQEGFVVARADLKKTLEDKLAYIGLSDKEIKDMVEYWYPYMYEKDFAYYRLTFFQNKEMNSFAPMNVHPRPDSVIRVFLDWEGLDEEVFMKPQALQKVERKGFTLVEWGGLKR